MINFFSQNLGSFFWRRLQNKFHFQINKFVADNEEILKPIFFHFLGCAKFSQESVTKSSTEAGDLWVVFLPKITQEIAVQ